MLPLVTEHNNKKAWASSKLELKLIGAQKDELPRWILGYSKFLHSTLGKISAFVVSLALVIFQICSVLIQLFFLNLARYFGCWSLYNGSNVSFAAKK